MTRRVRTYFICGLALVYSYANAVAVYAGETRFWEERRRAAGRLKDNGRSPDLGLPASSLTSEQRQLLAQLPAARQMDFHVTEPATLSGSIAAGRASGRSFEQADLEHIPSWISSLVLPYAAVRDIYVAPKSGAPLVIHVQDAHGIEEAQRNIAGLIESLRQERGISLVGLEGAAGAFAMDPFRAYPDPAVTKAIADYFLKDATITGAEYAGLTSTAPPLLWGIEDQTRYEENIQAFQDSLKNKPAVQDFLGSLSIAAAALRERTYSPRLKEFDKHAQAYQDRREGLGAYVGYLMSAYSGNKTRFPNLRLLTEALTWEDNLDFKRVEKDRLRLVESLARSLPETSLNLLVQQSLLYRAGRMTYGDYYRFLRSLCASNRIALSDFGTLGDYINYILIAERINRNELLEELFRIETAVQDALAAAVPEKRLVEASRSLTLLEKLTAHGMTPADWAAYQANRKQILSAPLELKVAAMDASQPDGRGEISVPARPPNFESLLAPFENFCAYALERNNALVDNLLSKMAAEKTPAAILVAGGFHTDGLTQVLRRKDVSYVVVTPKITDVPKENKYLDVFARDAEPLEKLFKGDKINLVDHQVNAVSSLGTVRSFYYRIMTIVLRHILRPLSPLEGRNLAKKIPGVKDVGYGNNLVTVQFEGEDFSRIVRFGGNRGREVELEFGGGKVSSRLEVSRSVPAAVYLRSLRDRAVSFYRQRLAGAALPALLAVDTAGVVALLVNYFKHHHVSMAVVGPAVALLVVFVMFAMTLMLLYAALSGRAPEVVRIVDGVGQWVSKAFPPQVPGLFMASKRPPSSEWRRPSDAFPSAEPGTGGSEAGRPWATPARGRTVVVARPRAPPEGTRLAGVLRTEMDNEEALARELNRGTVDPSALASAVMKMLDDDWTTVNPLIEDRLTAGGTAIQLALEKCVERLFLRGSFVWCRISPPLSDLNSIDPTQVLGNRCKELLSEKMRRHAQTAVGLGSYLKDTHVVLTGVDESRAVKLIPEVWAEVLTKLQEEFPAHETALEALAGKCYASHAKYELPTLRQVSQIAVQRKAELCRHFQWDPDRNFPSNSSLRETYLLQYLARNKAQRIREYELEGITDPALVDTLAEDDLRQDNRLRTAILIRQDIDHARTLRDRISASPDAPDVEELHRERRRASRRAYMNAMKMALEIDLKTTEAVYAVEKMEDESRKIAHNIGRELGLNKADTPEGQLATNWFLPATLTRGVKSWLIEEARASVSPQNKEWAFNVLGRLNELYATGRGKTIIPAEYFEEKDGEPLPPAIPRPAHMVSQLWGGAGAGAPFGYEEVKSALDAYEQDPSAERESRLREILRLYLRWKNVLLERSYRDMSFNGIRREFLPHQNDIRFQFKTEFVYEEIYMDEVVEVARNGLMAEWIGRMREGGDDQLAAMAATMSPHFLWFNKGDEDSLFAEVDKAGEKGYYPAAGEMNGMNSWNQSRARERKESGNEVEADPYFQMKALALRGPAASRLREGNGAFDDFLAFLENYEESIIHVAPNPFPVTVKPPDELRGKEGRMSLMRTLSGGMIAIGTKVYRVDPQNWKVLEETRLPFGANTPQTAVLCATLTVGDVPLPATVKPSARVRTLMKVGKYQKDQRQSNSGRVRTVRQVLEERLKIAQALRERQERIHKSTPPQGTPTAALPAWRGAFPRFAKTLLFVVALAPVMEIWGLPGFSTGMGLAGWGRLAAPLAGLLFAFLLIMREAPADAGLKGRASFAAKRLFRDHWPLAVASMAVFSMTLILPFGGKYVAQVGGAFLFALIHGMRAPPGGMFSGQTRRQFAWRFVASLVIMSAAPHLAPFLPSWISPDIATAVAAAFLHSVYNGSVRLLGLRFAYFRDMELSLKRRGKPPAPPRGEVSPEASCLIPLLKAGDDKGDLEAVLLESKKGTGPADSGRIDGYLDILRREKMRPADLGDLLEGISLRVPHDRIAPLLEHAGLSVAGAPDANLRALIEDRSLGLYEYFAPENVHVIRGRGKGLPAGWGRRGVFLSREGGRMHAYIHEDALRRWRSVEDDKGWADYFRSAAVMSLYRELVMEGGGKANLPVQEKLTPEGLVDLYQSGRHDPLQIMAVRARTAMSRLDYDRGGANLASPLEAMNYWFRWHRRADQNGGVESGARTFLIAADLIAKAGVPESLAQAALRRGAKAAEWGADTDGVVLQMLYPLYLQALSDQEQPVYRILEELFPGETGRQKNLISMLSRQADAADLAYNPSPRANKAPGYRMNVIRARIRGPNAGEILRGLIVDAFDLISQGDPAGIPEDLPLKIRHLYALFASRFGSPTWAMDLREALYRLENPAEAASIAQSKSDEFGVDLESDWNRREYPTRLMAAMQAWLDRNGIAGEVVFARKKTLDSIANKPREIHDLYGLKIVFEEEPDAAVRAKVVEFLSGLGKCGNPTRRWTRDGGAKRWNIQVKLGRSPKDPSMPRPMFSGKDKKGSPPLEVQLMTRNDYVVDTQGGVEGHGAHWLDEARRENKNFKFDDVETRLTGNWNDDVQAWTNAGESYIYGTVRRGRATMDVRIRRGGGFLDVLAHIFVNLFHPSLREIQGDRPMTPAETNSADIHELHPRRVTFAAAEPLPDGFILDADHLREREPMRWSFFKSLIGLGFIKEPRARWLVYKAAKGGVERYGARAREIRRELLGEEFKLDKGFWVQDLGRDLKSSREQRVKDIASEFSLLDLREFYFWLATLPPTEQVARIEEFKAAMEDKIVAFVETPADRPPHIIVRADCDRPGLWDEIQAVLYNHQLKSTGEDRERTRYADRGVRFIFDVEVDVSQEDRQRSLQGAGYAAPVLEAQVQKAKVDIERLLRKYRPFVDTGKVTAIHVSTPLHGNREFAVSEMNRILAEYRIKHKEIVLVEQGEQLFLVCDAELTNAWSVDAKTLRWLEATLQRRLEFQGQVRVEKVDIAPSVAPIAGMIMAYTLMLSFFIPGLPAWVLLAALAADLVIAAFAMKSLLRASIPAKPLEIPAATEADFRRAAEAFVEGTAPVESATQRLQGMVHRAVDNHEARFLSSDQLAREPDLRSTAQGKTPLFPILDLRKAAAEDAVSKLRPLLTEGHEVGGVIVVGVDSTARVAALEALQKAGVPMDRIHWAAAPSVMEDGRCLVDKAINALPRSQREALAKTGFDGVKFPVISPAAGQWTARDRKLRAAVVLLQILGDKLLRISLDAAESIYAEALRLSNA